MHFFPQSFCGFEGRAYFKRSLVPALCSRQWVASDATLASSLQLRLASSFLMAPELKHNMQRLLLVSLAAAAVFCGCSNCRSLRTGSPIRPASLHGLSNCS